MTIRMVLAEFENEMQDKKRNNLLEYWRSLSNLYNNLSDLNVVLREALRER